MTSPYAELGCQSSFSFLYATALPEDLTRRAAELDLDTLALSDFGGVYGTPRMHMAAKQVGIRAIVGARIDVLGIGRLRLLCTSRKGYQNLCRLLTLGHVHRPKGSCEVSCEDLAAYAQGLFCLAGSGLTALSSAHLLKRIFSNGHIAIEVSRHHDRSENRHTRALFHLADALSLPAVATGDVRLLDAKDKPLHDILTCIREHTTLAQAGRRLLPSGEWHLKSAAKMQQLFADRPDAINNSRRIAERCAFTLHDLGYRFPQFPTEGETQSALLRRLTFEMAPLRYRPFCKKARAQLERELRLIEKLDLAGYFLIVWDIVRFAKEQGILAQGRGSAANSAVCYVLGITAVDPVRMELLFERFLSEERGEWPDIDIDLPSGEPREKVIQYVYRKYGESGAAMTANVISYRDRSALRETGKALGFSPAEIDKVSRVCGHWGSIRDPAALGERLAQIGFDPKAPLVHQWLTWAPRMLHLPRHLGQHSGGMVIAEGRLDTVVPLEPASMPGRVVIQWDKDDCADLGIIKVDLLGLGMLQVLQDAVPLIRQQSGIEIDYAHLPADDPKVYEMLSRADTVGVFQVESRAQMATLPRLKPRCFYDLVIEVALIRPGPIVGQMVHPYLKRRAGYEPVTYAHPSLEPILARTLGVPLFQEQLMRMAMAVAGFSGGEAEELRRAMGFKRSQERMREIEAKLKAGMQARNIGKEAQEMIIHSITSFALYGFPESHSASFALIAYASAYLKAHHPAAFLCALLNAWPMGFYHPATLIKDAQRHGVRMLPIDITSSLWLCTLDDANTVRLGLRFVRGLRQQSAGRIVAERKRRPFVSLTDFEGRCRLSDAELDTLAELGALAALGHTRRQALWQVAGLPSRTFGLLGAINEEPGDSPLAELTLPERIAADFKNSSVSIGPQPMRFLRHRLDADGILSAAELASVPDGQKAQVAGIVRVRQRPGTARGLFFMTLEDETGFANLIVLPELFEAARPVVVGAGAVLATGRVQNREGVVHLRCDRVEDLLQAYPGSPAPETWVSRYG